MQETKSLQTTAAQVPSIQSWDELMRVSEFFSKSKLIPATLQGKPADVAIILQQGWELGIPPLQAINGINVIQGKPSVSPELGLALAYSRIPGFWCEFPELTESKAVVTMGRNKAAKAQAYTATWDIAKATKMQLITKDNYKKQPGVMLKWRAVMEALRVVAPDVLKGMYSSDEVEGFADDAADAPKDKASRLKGLAKKPPTKEVVCEVVNTETCEITPAAEAPAQEEPAAAEPTTPEENPLDSYVIKFGKEFKGKTFKEVGRDALGDYVTRAQAEVMKKGNPIAPDLQELFTKAEEYAFGPNLFS